MYQSDMQEWIPARKTLDEIAQWWATDKAWWGHRYTPLYEAIMEPLRSASVNVLELGWGSGCSAAAWLEYFLRANIVIIDNLYAPGWPAKRPCPIASEPPPEHWDNPRLHRYMGDQADAELIQQVVDKFESFDFIIDDASHITEKTIASFELLWPHVHPGGYYVIEDIPGSGRFTLDQMFDRVTDATSIARHQSHYEQDFSIAIIGKKP